MDGTSDALHAYVNTHRRAAIVGLSMARRMAARHEGTPLGVALDLVANEVEEDRVLLDLIAGGLGIKPTMATRVVPVVVDRIGRLRLRGVRRPPGAVALLELETLVAGIRAKELLWRALKANETARSVASRTANLDVLVERAEAQMQRLLPHHADVASGLDAARGQRATSVRSG
jgi:hypothetical protein